MEIGRRKGGGSKGQGCVVKHVQYYLTAYLGSSSALSTCDD